MALKPDSSAEDRGRSQELSYKFQRLRERIRAAVTSGELQGKLPGERALAKRFGVNAKTLSKALTDLAAEGLLDRSIGRGTYVKGTAPSAAGRKWLVLCTPTQAAGSLIGKLRASNSDIHVHSDLGQELRPSFLAPFSAVIGLQPDGCAALLHELVVRNMLVVTVDYQSKIFSTHAVLDDMLANATALVRQLLTEGHRSFVVVESRDNQVLSKVLQEITARIAPESRIDRVDPANIASIEGSVSILCESPELAAVAHKTLANRPDVTIWSIGCVDGTDMGNGCFTDENRKVAAILRLLSDPPMRPTVVWLAGQFRMHTPPLPPSHGGTMAHARAKTRSISS
jgi:hypothetical protein